MVRIGQKLHEERIKNGFSLEDVANSTKIRTSFLSAIEKGEYDKLPDSSYAKGFVLNYASFLGLPKRETLALFKRDFDEENAYKVLPDGLSRGEEFPTHRIRIQQTVLVVFFVLLMLFGYIAFQYRYVVLHPPLDITSPKNSVVSTREIIIVGKTDPNATVTIDENPVAIEKNGVFTKNVSLFEGENVIIIKATNRVGKETTIEKKIEVTIP